MKTCHHDQLFAARRVQQSADSRKSAGDVFRQRHIDSTLKKLLNRYDEKTQTICNPPTGDSIPKTSGPNAMTVQRIDHVDYAARRRAELAKWLETFERLQAVQPRTDEERQAQYEALELLRAARP